MTNVYGLVMWCFVFTLIQIHLITRYITTVASSVAFFVLSTVIGVDEKHSQSFFSAVGHFFSMFIGSAFIGTLFALCSALVSFFNSS